MDQIWGAVWIYWNYSFGFGEREKGEVIIYSNMPSFQTLELGLILLLGGFKKKFGEFGGCL